MRGCRPARGFSAAVLVVALCAGCSGSVDADAVRTATGPVTGVSVSGPPGEEPAVRIVAPLEVTATSKRVLATGTGEPVQVDQLFVLGLTLYDGRTGSKIASTYDPGQAPFVVKSTDDTLFPALSQGLLGLRQGGRLAMALTGADAYGATAVPPPGVEPGDPVVAVADVLAAPPVEVLDEPDGAAQEPPADAPGVILGEGGPVRIDFRGAGEPTGVVVVPLIEGTGPRVRDRSLVTLNHLDQAWGTRLPYASTYFQEPVVVPVGTEGSTPAWDEALVGLRRGSRVLVIAPYQQARVPVSASVPERATIAWIIDILGVS